MNKPIITGNNVFTLLDDFKTGRAVGNFYYDKSKGDDVKQVIKVLEYSNEGLEIELMVENFFVGDKKLLKLDSDAWYDHFISFKRAGSYERLTSVDIDYLTGKREVPNSKKELIGIMAGEF